MTSEQTLHFQVEQQVARLDQYLAEQMPDLSRSQLKKLIQQDKVLVAGRPAKPSSSLQPGDWISVYLPAPLLPSPPPSEIIPLDIIFEDEMLIVVNKPAGMVTHPGHGHMSGTLVNALLARYPDLRGLANIDPHGEMRPGLVHRLDQDTSGLIVVARTPAALKKLQQQFKARSVEKIYLALVFGEPQAPEGIIDVPLGRDPQHRQKIAPRADGRPARTHYRVMERFEQYSLLKVGLETGRTHQIRVHLAWLKCPVVGDEIYGRKKNDLGLTRQFLHAWQLYFQHPGSGQMVRFEATLAADLQAVLDRLRQG
jgi:23S rRNA pseudouridine1911/1915/1917 synthase